MTSAKDKGERALILRFKELFKQGPEVTTGIGDDCAVIANGDNDLVLTSDAVIAGVHFDELADPQQIGHKAVARLLSDIAAMGASPQWALLNITAPADYPADALEAIALSLSITADAQGLSIVGGDTACGPSLALHMFGIGTLPAGKAIARSGAAEGDCIFVTGRLGNSIAGRHLEFIPRLAEGIWLREQAFATAMIDLSDGMNVDLSHICEMSGVGADINTDQIPIAESLSTDPARLQHAVGDGEDYELLFTASADRADELITAWASDFAEVPLTRIGKISSGNAITYCDESGKKIDLSGAGYEHFSSNE